MTTHRECRSVAASRDLVFNLVAEVERYPEFLPMWRWVRVFSKRDGSYFTEQEIGLGPIRQRFRTRTLLSPHSHIDVTSSDQLFRRFHIRWDFAEMERGSAIGISLTWEVRSRLLQKAIDLALAETANAMIDAFESRARHRGRSAMQPATSGNGADGSAVGPLPSPAPVR